MMRGSYHDMIVLAQGSQYPHKTKFIKRAPPSRIDICLPVFFLGRHTLFFDRCFRLRIWIGGLNLRDDPWFVVEHLDDILAEFM